MNPHPSDLRPHSGDSEELASLYAAGAMEVVEADAFEQHLALGCTACEAALRELVPTVEALLAEVPPALPAAGLRERVMAAAEARPWTTWTDDSARNGLFTLASAQQGDWTQTGFPGIEVKRLFVDAANDRVTALFRMAPGTAYPAHRHAGPEECLVLEGELQVGGQILRGGDFQRAAVDSVHPTQSTASGCVLLITGSMRDELLRDCA